MKKILGKKWLNIGVVFDNDELKISNHNVWDYQWQLTGKIVEVKDPEYNRIFKADIYNIILNDGIIEFAAVEFSNCVWGFYLNE